MPVFSIVGLIVVALVIYAIFKIRDTTSEISTKMDTIVQLLQTLNQK